MPGRTSKVMWLLSCCIVKGVAPKGDVQICFGCSKSDVINVFCIFNVASPVSYGKKDRFPVRFLFLYPAFSCHAYARGAL